MSNEHSTKSRLIDSYESISPCVKLDVGEKIVKEILSAGATRKKLIKFIEHRMTVHLDIKKSLEEFKKRPIPKPKEPRGVRIPEDDEGYGSPSD